MGASATPVGMMTAGEHCFHYTAEHEQDNYTALNYICFDRLSHNHIACAPVVNVLMG
jgi:hypothetical protein